MDVPKKKRGRPPKNKPSSVIMSETMDIPMEIEDSQPFTEVVKKRRGRPPKAKSQEDLESLKTSDGLLDGINVAEERKKRGRPPKVRDSTLEPILVEKRPRGRPPKSSSL